MTERPSLSTHLSLGLLLLNLALGSAAQVAIAQTSSTPNLKTDALAQINRARLSNGLHPLALNPQLEKAAQRHSDDMARNNFLGDAGSDDSTAKERLLQAGYGAWAGERIIWGENLYADVADFAVALNFILGDASQSRIMLNARYREIGIGVTEGSGGGGKLYWTILYGAQPGVLPVFINDGQPVTNNSAVAVRMAQEDAVPGGEGTVIGKVIDVRLSADPNFPNATWQPWTPLIEFRFDTRPGVKTVHVQYRDGASRTTTATASIRYDPNATANDTIQVLGPGDIKQNETPTVVVSLTPEPTLTPQPQPSPTSSPPPIQATRTVVSDATPTAVVIGNTVVLPTATAPAPIPISTTPLVIPTAFVVEVAATEAALAPGSNSSDQPVINGSSVIASALPDSPDIKSNASTNTTLSRVGFNLPAWVLPVYLLAQGLVIVIGLSAFLRRK
jgi:uncharacterized protein YkwD